MIYKLVLGDWSEDGHGISKNILGPSTRKQFSFFLAFALFFRFIIFFTFILDVLEIIFTLLCRHFIHTLSVKAMTDGR